MSKEEVIHNRIDTNNEIGFLEQLAEDAEGKFPLNEKVWKKYFDDFFDKYNNYKLQTSNDREAKYLAFCDTIDECKTIRKNRLNQEVKQKY